METAESRCPGRPCVCTHVHTAYRLMCARRFQKPLNLNIRHPEVTDERNACMRWQAGGWQRPALLSAEEATYTGGLDSAFLGFRRLFSYQAMYLTENSLVSQYT